MQTNGEGLTTYRVGLCVRLSVALGAIVSGLSTAFAQLFHMPGYGVLRGVGGVKVFRVVSGQVVRVPDIGQINVMHDTKNIFIFFMCSGCVLFHCVRIMNP